MSVNKLVAVYGSLRQGLGNHGVLRDSELVGTTRVSGWEMFSLGGFPGIRSGSNEIIVEVYRVTSPDVALGLDRLEGFRGLNDPSNFYNKAFIETEFGESEIYTLENYGRRDNLPIVENGDWYAFRTGTAS